MNIRLKHIPSVAGTVLALLASGVFAAPIPDATTLLSVAAASRGDRFTQFLGPQNESKTLTLDWGDSFADYPWQIAAWHSTGAVTAELGLAIGQMGDISANAQANALGYRGESHATAGGMVQAYFQVRPIEPGSRVPDLLWVPIKLTARGQGAWTGNGWATNSRSGGYSMIVNLLANENSLLNPFPWQDFRVNRLTSETTPMSDSLEQSVTLGARAAGGLNQDELYLLTSAADCSVFAFGSHDGRPPEGTPLGASANCSASVASSISFDQPAFDADPAKYGATHSFKLADHYTLSFGGNMPAIPEPATGWLVLAGALVLAFKATRGWVCKAPI